MKKGTIYHQRTGTLLFSKVYWTETYFERARGLLGRPELTGQEGFLIKPCNSIHTCFMGYEIDALFLDNEMRIRKTVSCLSPWRFSSSFKASMVLELKAGMTEILNLKPDEQLIWKENNSLN